jgi:hypothetical protein
MSWIVEAPNNNPSVFVLISSTVFQIDGSCVRPPERLRMIHEAELGCREPQTGDRKWILSGGDRGPRGGHATIEDSHVGQRNQRGWWVENKGDQRRLDGLNGEPRTFTRQASLGFSKNKVSSDHVFSLRVGHCPTCPTLKLAT